MQQPIFFLMGALAAQTTGALQGFRQKDLKFYAELFSNWVELGGVGATHAIHNTQVMRFLRELVSDHHARVTQKRKQPSYHLTRAGVFTITSHLVSRSYLEERSHCILMWYFLKSYAHQIRENMQRAGSEFSRAHQIEMEQLLDRERFLHRQIQLVRHEIQRLQGRIASALDIDQAVRKLLSLGTSLPVCIEHVASHYPYELNPQRPFSATLRELPPVVCEWEITEGSRLRAQHLFDSVVEDLVNHERRLTCLVSL
jgi:hypothetical protein